MKTTSASSSQIVSELPLTLCSDSEYSFQRITRSEVTYGTHSLHKYPAKFIPQIPKWALQYDPDTPSQRILDPFCGSGTTLVEAGLTGAFAVGIDISPLAVVISRAKCSVIDRTDEELWHHLANILEEAQRLKAHYVKEFTVSKGLHCLGVHFTWANWFKPESIAGLVAIRDVLVRSSDACEDLKYLALAVLSSVTKACSYLNEDQIKVRFDHEKTPKDPFNSFRKAFITSAFTQREVGKSFSAAGAQLESHIASASTTMKVDYSFDRIITSPPYINAIDYTMAHKYNLFVLGLLPPEEFKLHCRAYIGVTERAVRAQDLKNPPACSSKSVKAIVRMLTHLGTPTALNRAYVLAQYFNGMENALIEGYRLLNKRGLYFLVVGESNRICNHLIPTADLLQEIAHDIGFTTEVRFFHVLANRSSMRLNRSITGGSIIRERIYVFRK